MRIWVKTKQRADNEPLQQNEGLKEESQNVSVWANWKHTVFLISFESYSCPVLIGYQNVSVTELKNS
jgi:hypothetical protein